MPRALNAVAPRLRSIRILAMDGKLGVVDVINGGVGFYYRLLGTKVAAL